jgi:dihydropteroate synthase
MSREPRADLAGVAVGEGLPVAVVGVVNVSPESFHPDSVYQGREDLRRAALEMVRAGASLIDVGGRSTAPYLASAVSEAEESSRLGHAIEILAAKLPVPISADTPRPGPARVALEAGARVINDVSALSDPALARLVARHDASLILMASPVPGDRRGAGGRSAVPRETSRHARQRLAQSKARRYTIEANGTAERPPAPRRSPSPVATVRNLLAAGMRRASRAGIPLHRIVVDPGVGFFRDVGMPWHEWDARVIAGLRGLWTLGRPICVGVSRKSFIGAILGLADTADRLSGSLAATAIAVVNGAAVVRTHDVAETREAVRVAERLRGLR